MFRKRTSVLAIKSISSRFPQVSPANYPSSSYSSQNSLLNFLQSSHLNRHRWRRSFTVAAQRYDFWSESDLNERNQPNASPADSRNSSNLQESPNGFCGESAVASHPRSPASFSQLLNDFKRGDPDSHQRCELLEPQQPNPNDRHQRGNLSETGHRSSDESNGKNPSIQVTNFDFDAQCNQRNDIQNVRSGSDAFDSKGIVSNGGVADDGYPYENQSRFFRETKIARNPVKSHVGNSIESFQENPRVLSGGSGKDGGYPYENQSGFTRSSRVNLNSSMNHTENAVEDSQQKPSVLFSSNRVGNEHSYGNQSVLLRKDWNSERNYAGNSREAFRQNPTILCGGSGVDGGSVDPGQLYQNAYGPCKKITLPDHLNSVEPPPVGSPLSNELCTSESLDIGKMISYGDCLNKLDEFCRQQKLKEAIAILAVFEKVGLVIDRARYLRLVQACGKANSIEKARLVHDHLSRRLGEIDVCVHNKILEMYSKCGSMADAHQLFGSMPCRNLTSWETMVRGLSDNGLGEEAIDLFTQFKGYGLKPDGGLFAAIIYTCGVLGAIDQGLLYYESMKVDFGIVPAMEHYISIVDMFGRNGYLDEALEFIEAMSIEPNVDVWETLMNFCRVNGYIELGNQCAEIVEQLDSSRVTKQSKMGLLPEESLEITKEEEMERSKELTVNRYVHQFMAGRPENYAIFERIGCLAQHMKEVGYIPDTAVTLHDVDQESREEALLYHSERLAVVYGLTTTPARATLRIIKNLRSCRDCHNALRLISKLTGRVIIARDAKRFHHFADGVCSCKDFW